MSLAAVRHALWHWRGDRELSPACQLAVLRIERNQLVLEGQGGPLLRQAAIVAAINRLRASEPEASDEGGHIDELAPVQRGAHLVLP